MRKKIKKFRRGEDELEKTERIYREKENNLREGIICIFIKQV